MNRGIKVGECSYVVNEYGMWRQIDPKPFTYTNEYINKQSTTEAMSWLRLGFLMSYLRLPLRDATCLEFGPGKGVFFEVVRPLVKEMHGYDVAPSKYSTLSLDEARKRKWDIFFAFDVIEHMSCIDDIWAIDFDVGFFSYPERPNVVGPDYRHLKPDEHIWHIKWHEFRQWVKDHGYYLVLQGHPEDVIRKPWSHTEHNISSSVIIKL